MDAEDCGCVIEKLLEKPFAQYSSVDKLEIITTGRPTPPLRNLTSTNFTKNKAFTRYFQEKNYEVKLWLCGCPALSKLFCWPCLLFASNPDRNVWCAGYCDLNHFTVAANKHIVSQSHINCCVSLKTFGANRIDLLLDAQKNATVSRHNEQVSENRKVLERLIDAVCFLASQELDFGRNDERDESDGKDNYVELLNLVAKYDTKLENHLKTSTIFKGTSNSIQNDLITAISKVVSDNIDREIDKANFVSVMFDEITDSTKKSQLSVVFRYVDESGVARERFYQFWNVTDNRTDTDISTKIIDLIKSKKNWGEKLVAQTYDGAAVMSGELNGTQAEVKNQFKDAIFVHCNAHVLNLVLSQSVNFLREVKVFFLNLSTLSSFFSQSTKRSYFLDQIIKRRLPTVAPTRWNYSSRLVNVVQTHLSDLVTLFDEMIDDPDTWGGDEIQARGFLQFLKSFNTVFLLNTFGDIFFHTDILFNVLQNKIFDINFCCEQIDSVRLEVNNLRARFQNIFEVSKNSIFPLPKREESLDSLELRYRQLFFEIIDTLSLQMETRFESLKRFKFLALLHTKRFVEYEQKFPTEAFECLESSYSAFFDFIKLKSELTVFFKCSQSKFKNISLKDIPKTLQILDLKDTFSEIFKLSELILTVPASSSSFDLSFSALKRIKSYARNKVLEQRLPELAIISIEKAFLKEIKLKNNFYDEVLQVFLKKSQRIELLYK